MSKHYHLIGIGGIGMGTLASLLLDQGHTVSGSDLKANEMTHGLMKRGASIFIGHKTGNIVKGVDYVVYSSAVRVNNPELIESESRNIPVLRRAEVLARLVNAQTGITIAGAHGKTTTTSMVSSLLINANLHPTTAIGGLINGQSAYNANLGAGKYFVAEVDESDGTFLYFNPNYSIITNMDFEHVDFYKNWDGIAEAYTKFIQGTHKDGCVIVCGEDERLTALAKQSQKKVITYGINGQQDVYASNVAIDGFQSSFTAHAQGKSIGDFELNVPGRHNILNALAAITLGLQLGISYEIMFKSLKGFTGVKRRFQLKGKVNDITVIDDYGHHPTEIAATLNAARLFSPKRLVTIFQPHRYSRTKFLLNEFVESLTNTDELILTDIYAASESITEGVGVGVLLEKIQQKSGFKVTFLKKDDILKHLQDYVQPGDMVLFLGAGDIYHLSDQLVVILNDVKDHKVHKVERVS